MEAIVKIERREFERVKLVGAAYAAIGPDYSRMGHIMNISQGGVAFSYIYHRDMPELSGETKILISDNVEALEEMPFIAILDTGAYIADPHSSVVIRHIRGRFGDLSPAQMEALMNFQKEKTSLNF